MNVYLIEDDDGVTVFDAGIEAMGRPCAPPCARLGGVKRVVLGHADADHRGAAPALGAPVYCHPAERDAAESGRSRCATTGTCASCAPTRGRTSADAAGLGRRRRRDRGHGRRGRRDRRLRGRRPARPRARPDRPVSRVRPAGARLRLLLHARPPDRAQGRPAGPAPRVRRRRRAGARLDPQARRARARGRRGPGTPIPSPATSRGQLEQAAAAPADGARRARARQQNASSPRRSASTATPTATCWCCAASLTPGDAPRVRRDARRRPAPRGRAAARDRAAVRAPGGVVDDRGPRDRRARRSCSGRYRMASAAEREFVRASLREHLAEHFPSSRRRDDAARPIPTRSPRCCATGAWRSAPATASARLHDPGRADLAAALHRAVLERDAWPYVAPRAARPGRRPLPPRARAPPHRGRRRPLAVVGRAGRLRADRRAGQHHRAGRRRPGADRPGGRRAPAVAGGAAAAALVRHDLADAGAGPAGADERRRYAAFVTRALFLDRPDPVAAWRELSATPGGAGRAADARRGDPDRGRGHRHPPRRRRSHLDQLRRPAQHAQRRGLHRAARALGQRHDPLHRAHRAARRDRHRRRADLPRRRGGRGERRARRGLPPGGAGHRRRRALPRRARDRHQHRHRPRDRPHPARREDGRHRPPRARAAPIRRPAAPTTRRCTGT